LAQVVVLKIYKNGQLVEQRQMSESHIVLGSSKTEANITLSGDVSPIHASIDKRDNGYMICDMGSEKGTYKNNDKILEAQIQPGDKIKIGDFLIEFYLQEAVTESTVTTATSISDIDDHGTLEVPRSGKTHPHVSADKVPEAVIAEAGTAVVGSGQPLSRNTFAPASAYKNVNEFIRPTKGTTVEVLVAWRERVISANHFNENGTVTVGTHPDCDVIVPLISSNVNKAPLLQINNQVQIMLYQGMEGSLVSESQATPFSQLANIGRGSGQSVVLQQGEMARIQLGGEVEIIIRYASQAPKPVIIPFMDLSSNGFLAVLLAIVLSGILSLIVALNKMEEFELPDEDEYRTALILQNVPKPPKPKIKLPPPPKKKPAPMKKKRIKLTEKKVEPKKKATLDMTKKSSTKPKTNVAKAGQNARARGSGRDASPMAMRKKDGKKTNRVTSVKQGGAVKTARKQGAQAQSERKLKKSGIFSAFGTDGRNDRLDQSYEGGGELAGLADQATGEAGFAEDRAGKGLGSKFKDTGAGGNGRSNVGVSGLSKGGKGLGAGGFGSGGLGDRKAVTIIPGGAGEEFSGQIDREGIRKVFFDNQRAIRSCYERELNRNPNLSGVLRLNFDIGELGRVVGSPSINWGDSSLKSRTVAGCILNRLKTWRFPEPPRNQVVNVIYPLAFQSK
jgi:hypothetical protein